jgi:hypothetical protein
MADRLQGSLAEAGVPAGVQEAVVGSFSQAILLRGQRGIGEFDPRFLHPGRTVLILLEDAQVKEPHLLCAAPWLDTWEPTNPPEPKAWPPPPEPAVRQVLARIPLLSEGLGGARDPGEESAWLEALLGLEAPLLALTLAETLDHLRHLHLRAKEDPSRARAAARAEEVFLPLSERLGETLARRFRWWCGRVGRQLLKS